MIGGILLIDLLLQFFDPAAEIVLAWVIDVKSEILAISGKLLSNVTKLGVMPRQHLFYFL